MSLPLRVVLEVSDNLLTFGFFDLLSPMVELGSYLCGLCRVIVIPQKILGCVVALRWSGFLLPPYEGVQFLGHVLPDQRLR